MTCFLSQRFFLSTNDFHDFHGFSEFQAEYHAAPDEDPGRSVHDAAELRRLGGQDSSEDRRRGTMPSTSVPLRVEIFGRLVCCGLLLAIPDCHIDSLIYSHWKMNSFLMSRHPD